MAGLQPFHVAVPVHDLEASRRFYGELLGCREGRSAAHWVDFDLFGHQFVCHLQPAQPRPGVSSTVDGAQVPVPHYGVVLTMPDWQRLAARLRAAGVDFIVEPGLRFAGLAGEQATFFLLDPSGNALEFKAFADPTQLFATGDDD